MKFKKIIIFFAILLLQMIMTVNAGAVSYEYDDLGRVTTVTYSSGKTVSYEYDSNGNIVSTSALGDKTIVPTPVNFAVEEVTNKSISFTWEQPESDDHAVIEYQVYRNGNLVEYVTENRFEDIELEKNSYYSYYIIAIDLDGECSPMSEVFSVKTNRFSEISDVFSVGECVQVAGGGYHTIALKEDGTVWAWGNNDYGQLGNGTYDSSSVPQRVEGLTEIIKISTRTDHNLALKADGTLWAWGDNTYGQLGDGSVEGSNVPVKVAELNNVTDISAGHQFSLAILSNGYAYSWGHNKDGQLGIGSTYRFFKTPQMVKNIYNVAQVSAGHYHALAVDKNGDAWAWGSNSYGQLGNGTTESGTLPIKVRDDILSVCAGLDNSFFAVDNIEGDGFAPIYVCGYNDNGQLGTGDNLPVYTLAEVTTVNELGVSGEYFYALRNMSSNSTTLLFDSGVHMSGMNYYGQFGNGNNRYRICEFVHQFYDINDSAVQYVSAGSAHSVILADGKVYCAGLNNYGQCGIDTNIESINTFVLVE